jgi:2-keto-4-pentenoate hydratase
LPWPRRQSQAHKGAYSFEEVLDALGDLTPAMEITARRVPSPDGDPLGPWVVADGGGCGAVVVGGFTLPRSVWAGTDFAETEVELWLNGASAGEGLGAAVLGNPVNSIVWLADSLAHAVGGASLKEGDVVITGTMHGKTAVPADLHAPDAVSCCAWGCPFERPGCGCLCGGRWRPATASVVTGAMASALSLSSVRIRPG